MTQSDGYLTMARIMDKELEKFIRERSMEWRNMTGREQIITKSSFQSGFMAGFSGRYFNNEEN